MRIAIAGAGWFGCHLCVALTKAGHTVSVYDSRGIFSGASGNNQDRVHLGFHYPRSAKTRKEITHCYNRFVEMYPVSSVLENIYAVANESAIDFDTYTAICTSAGLSFTPVDPTAFGLEGVEGAVMTKEKVVETHRVISMFNNQMSEVLPYDAEEVSLFDHEVRVNGDKYDAFINCTNLRLKDANLPVYYEAAMVLEAVGPVRHHSFTIMDGQFPTLLATSINERYSISHVKHTAVKKCVTFEWAQDALDTLDWKERIPLFTNEVCKFYPDFKKKFEIVGWRGAVRTKPINGTDSRECLTVANGRSMTVVCGKFASVFLAEERVTEWLRSLSAVPVSSAPI